MERSGCPIGERISRSPKYMPNHYTRFMNRPLEIAIGKLLRLPEDKQEIAAEMLEQLAQSDAPPFALSPEERTIVREALARSQRGEFADDTAVVEALRYSWS